MPALPDLKTIIYETHNAIKEGKVILYPTDTVWGLGCDATNPDAVSRIYEIKQRIQSKALICLVDGVPMLERFVEHIPEAAYDIIDHSERPTTIIYDGPLKLAKNLIGTDNTIAIRVTSDPFCKRLIHKMRVPLVSTSANVSGQPTPQAYDDIAQEIKDSVDYIVKLPNNASATPSMIIKLDKHDRFTMIRK